MVLVHGQGEQQCLGPRMPWPLAYLQRTMLGLRDARSASLARRASRLLVPNDGLSGYAGVLELNSRGRVVLSGST